MIVECKIAKPLIVLSTKPTACDPILAFSAWGDQFLQGVVGVNHMAEGKMTISGLPAGKLHLAAFANDNNPGFGAMEIKLNAGERQSVELPIIASWSNAHKQPPQRLVELVDHFKANSIDTMNLQERIAAKIRSHQEQHSLEIPFFVPSSILRETLKVNNGEVRTVADILAAQAYAELNPPINGGSLFVADQFEEVSSGDLGPLSFGARLKKQIHETIVVPKQTQYNMFSGFFASRLIITHLPQ